MRHPDGRRMTPEEKRGFDLACDELMIWGQRIALAGRNLAQNCQDIQTIPMHQLMETKGNFVTNLARALQVAGEVEGTDASGTLLLN